MKQVIVLRKDLKMRAGKAHSQCAHAAMLFLMRRFVGAVGGFPSKVVPNDDGNTTLFSTFTPDEMEWISGAFTKVVVGGDSEEHLLSLQAQAKELGLEAHLMIDNGETEFGNVPTLTALAIGPARSSVINLITGNLKLL